MAPRVRTVQREPGVSLAELGYRVAEACDEIGANGSFVVGHPDVLRPDSRELGPFVRDSDTSREAAVEGHFKWTDDRKRVLLAVADKAWYGATREELGVALSMHDKTVGPRVWELVHRGFLAPSGRKRKTRSGRNADVLIVTELGRAAVAELAPTTLC